MGEWERVGTTIRVPNGRGTLSNDTGDNRGSERKVVVLAVERLGEVLERLVLALGRGGPGGAAATLDGAEKDSAPSPRPLRRMSSRAVISVV